MTSATATDNMETAYMLGKKYIINMDNFVGDSSVNLKKKTKEIFHLTTAQHILFMVLWRRVYGIGPFRQWERKPVAASKSEEERDVSPW